MIALNPVQLEIIRNALTAVSEEMSVTVRRTSRSALVREMLDYSTAVFDAKGRNVAQSAHIPIHLNTMAPFLQHILEHHIPAEAWKESDVVLSNDPYCGGQHLPDLTTFRAVFQEGKHIGFVGTMAHYTDIGGSVAGSYNAGATEIFGEGIRIPPVRIIDDGVLNVDLLSMMLQNVRQRDIFRGDLMSQIASLDIGARRWMSAVAWRILSRLFLLLLRFESSRAGPD